jgi:prepilin-type N-terminal cleavage/methylation domain-containing protein
MKCNRVKGFTIVELLVVVSIIALLIGILLPAIAKARDSAKVSQSRSNIRNVWMALLEYESDWNSVWTGSPGNLSAGNEEIGGIQTSRTGQSITNAIAVWNSLYAVSQPFGLQIGETPDGNSGGVLFWNARPYNMAPYCFSSGLTTSTEYPRLGTFRFPNTRQIAEYINDDPLDKTFFAPKDYAPLNHLEQCFEFPGTYCPSSGQPSSWPFEPRYDYGLPMAPSSYCISPAAMYHPKVYEWDPGAEDGNMGFRDPMSFGAGFRAPSFAQAQFSDLKTYLMEHNWLNNLTASECGSQWGGTWHDPSAADSVNWGGCEPWYFNHAFRSAPVTAFLDGHIELVEMAGTERDDAFIASTGGGGLWHRGTPDGANGYWIPQGTDWTAVSIHTHTQDGIRGRDRVNR